MVPERQIRLRDTAEDRTGYGLPLVVEHFDVRIKVHAETTGIDFKNEALAFLGMEAKPFVRLVRAELAVDGSRRGKDIARRFQRTVSAVTVDVCRRIATERGLNTVALSGGCFQNRMLLADVIPALEQEGFQVLTHHQVPCNDGGLSLGQVAVAHQTRE